MTHAAQIAPSLVRSAARLPVRWGLYALRRCRVDLTLPAYQSRLGADETSWAASNHLSRVICVIAQNLRRIGIDS
jgi:hypothetical protein